MEIVDTHPLMCATPKSRFLTIGAIISTALEVSNDLTNWQSLGPEFQIASRVDNPDGTATVTITRSAPLPYSRLLFRYAVSLAS